MFTRLIKIFTNPKEYWNEAIAEPGDVKSLLFPQMLILAAIPSACTFLGQLWRYMKLEFIRATLGSIMGLILFYAFSIAAWLLLGFIIDALAVPFRAQRNLSQSLKLATGTIIPMWIGSSLAIIPLFGLGIIGGIGGLGYGAYVLYLGLPIMNGTSSERSIGYTAAVIGLLFVISMILVFLADCPMSCMLETAMSRFPY